MPSAYQSFVSQHWNRAESWGDNIKRIAAQWRSRGSAQKAKPKAVAKKKVQSGGMIRLMPFPIDPPKLGADPRTWGPQGYRKYLETQLEKQKQLTGGRRRRK